MYFKVHGRSLAHRSKRIHGELVFTILILNSWGCMYFETHYTGICQKLVQVGADGNAAGLDGSTPLARAVLSENSDIFRLLIPKRTQLSDISDVCSFVEHSSAECLVFEMWAQARACGG